jgi:O-antigen/teichoic acid export membrane protein
MPTFIIYWFLSYFDRVIITNILGNESLGIYAIGAKVASASQIIYMAFSGGWQYFSFSTMQDEDQVALTSRVFEYLGMASFTIFLLLLPFNEILFNYLFKGNFRLGYEVFPYLFLAPLMLMLFQTLNNQLIIIKKGYIITIILSMVVLSNVMMTYFFTLYLGIKGSALATLGSYLIAVALILIYLKQNKLIEVNARFLICTFSTLLIVFFNFISLSYLNVCCILALLSFYLFYRKDFKLRNIKKTT